MSTNVSIATITYCSPVGNHGRFWKHTKPRVYTYRTLATNVSHVVLQNGNNTLVPPSVQTTCTTRGTCDCVLRLRQEKGRAYVPSNCFIVVYGCSRKNQRPKAVTVGFFSQNSLKLKITKLIAVKYLTKFFNSSKALKNISYLI